MKKILNILFVVCFLGLMNQSCNKSKEESTPPYFQEIIGEWHLVKWNGVDAQDTQMDVYLSFDQNSTFVIYQHIDNSNYQKYTGTFSISDKVLFGFYSDDKPWGSKYDILFDSENKQLTLTSKQYGVLDVANYERTKIPAEIRDIVQSSFSTRTSDKRWL